MNKKQAMRMAKDMCSDVIQDMMGGGWPFTIGGIGAYDCKEIKRRGVLLTDKKGRLTKDGDRLTDALYKIVARLDR